MLLHVSTLYRDGAIEMDDESPLSSCTESRNSGGFMHNFGDDAIGKDFEESPVLLTPGWFYFMAVYTNIPRLF